MRSQRTQHVLLVEDDIADVELIRQSLRDTGVTKLHHAPHGRDALAFLRREPPHENAPSPDLILLDLNMPIMNGRETLAALREDPALHRIPVVVMTSSIREEDVSDAYRLCANCYVRKPLDLADLEELVRALQHFWLGGVVTLPRSGA